MLGVHDAHLNIKRQSPACLGLWERELNNAYWELDKGKIPGDSYVTATHPALNSVCCYTFGGKRPCRRKKKPRSRELVCMLPTKSANLVAYLDIFIAAWRQGGLKLLNRIGNASERSFRTVRLAKVTHFVSWDIHENNWFQVWGVVMRQQEKGVPIGVFLSAQLMCICSLATEHHFNESPEKVKLLQPFLQNCPQN